MRLAMRLSAAAAIVLLALVPATLHAQDARLEVRSDDGLKSVLTRHVGKRVTLVLTTGPELSGVVASVGDHVVHLTALTGREFFDAVVGLDRVSAVVVRVRGQ
jgi:hypothetical protein